MRNTRRLTQWDRAVAAYLANRRALGRAYTTEEWILCTLRRYLDDSRATDLDQSHFDRWRRTLGHLNPNTRRGRELAVYNFCRYRRRSEPRCFLPNPLSFARLRPYRLPTIIEPTQIVRLLTFASALPSVPQSPLQPFVMRLAIVLLYTAGLRRGELVRLRLEDVDSRSGVLRIRESKFHKSRWVPLSPSACADLRRYLIVRTQAQYRPGPTAPLLFNGQRSWPGYTGAGLAQSIRRLLVAAGIRNSQGRTPRTHDFRHSFAAGALLRWYEDGADVQSSLPRLALYMGHVSIVSTAYYLRCMPGVAEHASGRFERSCARVVERGAL